MKMRILFTIIMLLMVCPLWAQEFVWEEVDTLSPRVYRDTCAYYEKGFREALKTYNDEPIGSGFSIFMRNSDRLYSKSLSWLEWLYYRVIPRDLWPLIDSCPECRTWSSIEYQGLAMELYYDEKGTILTARFYVNKKIRDKIAPRLKEIHEALMKEKIPTEFMKRINILKEKDWPFNKRCFREFSYQARTEYREYMMTKDSSWPARKAEFDSISDSNNRDSYRKGHE